VGRTKGNVKPKKTLDQMYECTFIDVGGKGRVPYRNFRFLRKDKDEKKPFAHQCSLNDFKKFSRQETLMFKEWTRLRKINMCIIYELSGVWFVYIKEADVALDEITNSSEQADIASGSDISMLPLNVTHVTSAQAPEEAIHPLRPQIVAQTNLSL